MKVIAWANSALTVTLVAQSDPELKYLNHLIFEGKAIASGDRFEVIVTLKKGKSATDYRRHLSTKLHFQVEESKE